MRRSVFRGAYNSEIGTKENEALDQCSLSMMRLDSCELPTMCRCYDLWVLINNQIDGLHSLILLIIC